MCLTLSEAILEEKSFEEHLNYFSVCLGWGRGGLLDGGYRLVKGMEVRSSQVWVGSLGLLDCSVRWGALGEGVGAQ